MQYLILISNPRYKLSNINEIASTVMNTYLNEKDNVLSVKGKEGYITIRRSDEVLNDYDDDELNHINSSLKCPEVYIVNYKNVSEVKYLLKYIANRDDIFIDTDTGLLLTGKEFNSICDSKPEWNWLDKIA